MVKAIVKASDKPSGIADTASATTDKNIAFISYPFIYNKIPEINAIIKIEQGGKSELSLSLSHNLPPYEYKTYEKSNRF